ncbi:MAG: hypothetical protein PHC51_09180 [bacterium]|nr:hypothetical protein [bacterium]
MSQAINEWLVMKMKTSSAGFSHGTVALPLVVGNMGPGYLFFFYLFVRFNVPAEHMAFA